MCYMFYWKAVSEDLRLFKNERQQDLQPQLEVCVVE